LSAITAGAIRHRLIRVPDHRYDRHASGENESDGQNEENPFHDRLPSLMLGVCQNWPEAPVTGVTACGFSRPDLLDRLRRKLGCNSGCKYPFRRELSNDFNDECCISNAIGTRPRRDRA
jgi:hypothetical protein